MRRFFSLVASISVLAACSEVEQPCLDEDVSFNSDVVETVAFEILPIKDGDDLETKTAAVPNGDVVSVIWEATDTVGIFPNTGSQIYFNIENGVGTGSVTFDGGSWALKQGSAYTSYYPFVGDIYLKRNCIPVSFTGQKQIGTTSPFVGARYYLATAPSESDKGKLTFHYNTLNTIINVNATLPAGTYTKMSLNISDPLFVEEGTYSLDDFRIVGTNYSNSLEIELEDVVLTESGTIPVYIMSAPVDLKDKEVIVVFTAADGRRYKCVKNVTRNYLAGTRYGLTCKDFAVDADDDSVTYAKASSITVGGTYLIVDKEDKRLFKGTADGKYVNVSPQDNVITDIDGSLAGYEFTVEKSGNYYYLKYNDGKYLVCDYTGNSAGLNYVNAQSNVKYPYTLTTGGNGAFFFSTTQVNDDSKTNQVLYYKSEDNAFKIGGSGTSIGVHLYLKDGVPEPTKQDRDLSFNPETVTCTFGEDPQEPALFGTYTTVTYSSSDNKIATVNASGTVTPVAPGIVTITATAEEDDLYNAGSASYTLKIKKVSTSGIYSRVTSLDEIQLGGEYVIIYEDGSTQKAFKPILNAGQNAFQTTNNAVDVLIIDDEIDAAEVDDCRFTLANQDGTSKKFSLIVPEADGISDYYMYVYRSGVFTAMKVDDSADTGYRPAFSLSPDGKLTMKVTSGYGVRFSSDSFSATNTGSSDNLYLFVRSDGPAKQKQSLSFAEPTVTWTTGGGYDIGQSYDYPQTAAGAKTTVTYSAKPESVAKIEGGKIKIVGPGSAAITATAERTDQYYGATASYTLRIIKMTDGWVDLGSFSLENKAFADYMDDANRSYSDNDDATNSVMSKYVGLAYSYVSRKDCPAPVPLSWTNVATSSTVITIYEDQAMAKRVWSQNATAGATSADVYNLIPGRTYYYTVSEDSVVWEQGYFSTTGRRRMIKVSDSTGRGYANNCRDLGGLEVMDKGVKKTIRYGFLFRGTNMDKTTQTAEWPILLDFMNVGMDIDLRNGETVGTNFGSDGSQYRNRPLPTSIGYTAPGFMSDKNFPDLTTIEKVHDVVMAFFNTVKSGKAVYFHCFSGADRTGYIAMLIEGLLGVSEKDCSIDYELTSFCESVGGRYRTGLPTDYDFRDGIAFLRGFSGDTFQDKVENYVKSIGITQDQIDEFKGLVLE